MAVLIKNVNKLETDPKPYDCVISEEVALRGLFMKNQILQKTVAAILSFAVVISAFLFQSSDAFAEESPESKIETVSNVYSYSDLSFDNYVSRISDYVDEKCSLESVIDKELNVGDSCLFKLDFSVNALCELELYYRALKSEDLVVRVYIDDKIPFFEAENLSFRAYYKNDKVKTDKFGNEYAPNQVLYPSLIASKAFDYTGKYKDPFVFAFSSGVHTVKIEMLQGSAYISKCSFVSPEKVKKYNAPTKTKKLSTKPVVIEGENSVLKNNKSLISLSDLGSNMVNPNDPNITKLNYIGGSNSGSVGSSYLWDFEIKQSGYYSLGFICRQNYQAGSVSYRKLLIDGKSPFYEATQIPFKYNEKWHYESFGDKNNPYYIYLKSGKHTLELITNPGEFSEVYKITQNIVDNMGNLYVSITKIIGETVDVSRSYELFNQIPEFNDKLDDIIKGLDDVISKMTYIQGDKAGSSISIIQNARRIIKQMRDNPYSSHKYKSQFYDSYTNLSAIMSTMTNMPLDIDRIIFVPFGQKYDDYKKSFFEDISYGFQRLLYTFVDDYKPQDNNNESLTIWVNWGRDQAKSLSNIVQSSFVAETGIDVDISIVNATLVQAIIAGNGPDVMLQMSRTEPVNLAMRGALVDLSSFDDYSQVIKRFAKNATEPYKYKKGVYALPDTQSFFMMFGRTDILEDLGLNMPSTWDEFLYTTSILQRNNLQVSLPYTQITSSGTVNTGVGGLTLYPTLLAQHGLSLYNDKGTATTLSEPKQIKVFSDYSSWYTKYKIPVTTDFFNRFRVGSAPLGIAGYTLYTQLVAAAPEISGRWAISVLPSTVRDDGKLSFSSAGSGSGCAITKLSKNPENAWEFLKWWTSAETQLEYSNSLESVIGPLGRVNTSNIEAFSNMNWDIESKKQIIKQWENVVEIIEVPGGYYTARGIDQAYWSVIEQGGKPKDQLNKWSLIVDNEIKRKEKEFSY